MKLSKHAQKRLQQRGFSFEQLKIIQKYGIPKFSKEEDRLIIDFKYKEYKQLVGQCDILIKKIHKIKKCAEKAKNKRLIITSNSDIIITMHRLN